MLDRCLPKQVAVQRIKRDWDQDILSRYRALVSTQLFSSVSMRIWHSDKSESIISPL